MSKPIYEYLAEAEGRTWTAEDSTYIRTVFRQVETLAEGVIERRTAELQARSDRNRWPFNDRAYTDALRQRGTE